MFIERRIIALRAGRGRKRERNDNVNNSRCVLLPHGVTIIIIIIAAFGEQDVSTAGIDGNVFER